MDQLPGMDNPKAVELARRVEAMEAKTIAVSSPALQSSLTKLAWVVTGAILVGILFIGWVWHSQLPPIPKLESTAEQMSNYRELNTQATENVKSIVNEVFARVLLPVLTLIVGVIVGRNLPPKTTD